MNAVVKEKFGVEKPIIGMVHLYGGKGRDVREDAKADIETLYNNGIDAVMVEDFYGTPDDIEWTLEYLKTQYTDRVYGVNLLGNTQQAFVLADRYQAKFMQIDSVCGHLKHGHQKKIYGKPDLNLLSFDDDFAKRIQELREEYPVFILGGVRFKFQPVLSERSVEEDLRLGKQRCDAVMVSGKGESEMAEMENIQLFRKVLGDYPLFVGTGVTLDNCESKLALTDGAIVGTWLKENANPKGRVNADRVRRFMEKARQLRGAE